MECLWEMMLEVRQHQPMWILLRTLSPYLTRVWEIVSQPFLQHGIRSTWCRMTHDIILMQIRLRKLRRNESDTCVDCAWRNVGRLPILLLDACEEYDCDAKKSPIYCQPVAAFSEFPSMAQQKHNVTLWFLGHMAQNIINGRTTLTLESYMKVLRRFGWKTYRRRKRMTTNRNYPSVRSLCRVGDIVGTWCLRMGESRCILGGVFEREKCKKLSEICTYVKVIKFWWIKYSRKQKRKTGDLRVSIRLSYRSKIPGFVVQSLVGNSFSYAKAPRYLHPPPKNYYVLKNIGGVFPRDKAARRWY